MYISLWPCDCSGQRTAHRPSNPTSFAKTEISQFHCKVRGTSSPIPELSKSVVLLPQLCSSSIFELQMFGHQGFPAPLRRQPWKWQGTRYLVSRNLQKQSCQLRHLRRLWQLNLARLPAWTLDLWSDFVHKNDQKLSKTHQRACYHVVLSISYCRWLLVQFFSFSFCQIQLI